MSVLDKELQALKMKQTRIEQKQKSQNEEVWSRIQVLEKLAREIPGVEAGPVSPSVQIALNKAAIRRGYKK